MIGWFTDAGYVTDTSIGNLSDIVFLDTDKIFSVPTLEVVPANTSISGSPDVTYAKAVEIFGDEVSSIYKLPYILGNKSPYYDVLKSYFPSMEIMFPNSFAYRNNNKSATIRWAMFLKNLSKVLVCGPQENNISIYNVGDGGILSPVLINSSLYGYNIFRLSSGSSSVGIALWSLVNYQTPSDLLNSDNWVFAQYTVSSTSKSYFEKATYVSISTNILNAIFMVIKNLM